VHYGEVSFGGVTDPDTQTNDVQNAGGGALCNPSPVSIRLKLLLGIFLLVFRSL